MKAENVIGSYDALYRIEDPEERARALNGEGINAMNRGEFSVAIEMLLEAKNSVGETNPEYMVSLSNTGKLYDVLGRPDIGYENAKQAEILYQERMAEALAGNDSGVKELEDQFMEGRINNLCLMTSLALKLGELEQAKHLMQRIRKLHPENDIHSNILMTQIQYYLALGNMEAYERCIRIYFSILPSLLTHPDLMQQANEMCIFFMKVGRIEEAARVFDLMRKPIEECSEVAYKVIYLMNKIEYDEIIGDEAAKQADVSRHYDLMLDRIRLSVADRVQHTLFREKMVEMDLKQKQMYEENLRLQRLSDTDPLTQIPNRKAFDDCAAQMLSAAEANRESFAVEIMDLDYFKQLNDSYGHQAGDQALKTVGGILAAAAFESPGRIFVSRNGGDEFCVIYRGYDEKEVREIAESFRRQVAEAAIPNRNSAISKYLTISQGLCFVACPESDLHLWELMHAADQALYEIKQNGKSAIGIRMGIHEPVGDSREKWIEANLERALERGEFEAWYQPITRSVSGAISEYEALARWNSPECGMISPAEFIPMAEEMGVSGVLDQTILRSVLRDIRWKMEAGQEVQPVSVNLSQKDFADARFTRRLTEIVDQAEVPHDYVIFEITESACVDSPELLHTAIQDLHENGFRVWMDDFGSGYSSLNVLSQYDFDLLKLDMKFLERFSMEGRGAVVLRHVLAMAKELHILTLVEGVETQDQFLFLKSLSCDRMQGYFFQKPTPLSFYKDKADQEPEEPSFVGELKQTGSYYDAVRLAMTETDGMPEHLAGLFHEPPFAVLEMQGDTLVFLHSNMEYMRFLVERGLVMPDMQDPRLRGQWVMPMPPAMKQAVLQSEAGACWVNFEDLTPAGPVKGWIEVIARDAMREAVCFRIVVEK